MEVYGWVTHWKTGPGRVQRLSQNVSLKLGWLILCVSFTGSQGAQLFGLTLFWVFVGMCFGNVVWVFVGNTINILVD